jgi:hypothetical protein
MEELAGPEKRGDISVRGSKRMGKLVERYL